jgi:hypothetical protein
MIVGRVCPMSCNTAPGSNAGASVVVPPTANEDSSTQTEPPTWCIGSTLSQLSSAVPPSRIIW